MRLSALLSILLFFSGSLYSAIIHVPADQPTIQAGINAAIAGDTVLVADGTYTGDGNRDIDFGGKGVLLKSENGPDVTIIDCQATSSELHRGLIFHSGEDSTAIVDGFTIQNGRAQVYGGGIFCNLSSPIIANCIIKANFARAGGAGIGFFNQSHAIVRDNIISDNTVEGSGEGGGIFCALNTGVKFVRNMVRSNSATDGGGIYVISAVTIIFNNTITENSATAGSGGGIYIFDAEVTMNDNTITNNTAIGDGIKDAFGGGIYCHNQSNVIIKRNTIAGNSVIRKGNSQASGGGIANQDRISLAMSENSISDNVADDNGGGVFCVQSISGGITNNSITGNASGQNGGGIYSNSGVTILNNAIIRNSADQGGGLFYLNSNAPIVGNIISGNSVSSNGGGILLFRSSPALIDNAITANIAEHGGGIALLSHSNPQIIGSTIGSNTAWSNGSGLYMDSTIIPSTPVLENTIIAFGKGDGAVWTQNGWNKPSFTCSDIFGNEGGDWNEHIAEQSEVNGNFSLNPFFCDRIGGDFHLNANSPCLSSNNECGLLIGAFDVGCNYSCGDADGDGAVTQDDLTFLINFYFLFGTPPVPLESGDVTGDGVFDLSDIVYLATYLNNNGPAPCPGSEPPPGFDPKKKPVGLRVGLE